MTMSLSTGLISGMDTGALVSQLIAAEAGPQTALKARLGVTQNAASAYRTVNTTVENLTASESRIRDADMAQEKVQFTRNQILSQAGTSMLAQANQASQGVLSLLRG